ncbi:MAG: CapA family protein [Actinomycetota bacterium]|nr:CapA family protein [Actinomycetota bacterium]
MASRLIAFVGGLVVLVAACGTVGPPSARAPVPATSGDAASTTTPTTATAPTIAVYTIPTLPEVPVRRSFTMAFTGDFLLHNRVISTAAAHAAGGEAVDGEAAAPARAYDFRPLLEPIRPWVERADWAVCHMEVNLSADGTRLSPFPMFRSPGEIAFDAADLGYDACTTASNHVLDQGLDGVAETLGVLDAAGLRSTGSARTATEAHDQVWFRIGGVKVAHLSYSYGFNGFSIPDEAPWTTRLIDERAILRTAAEARSAGAEYVVLSLHWGNQYLHRASSQQADLGPRLLASPDIDLIIGHHAHVVQPIERIDGEWLVYGLGNLLANYVQAPRRDELLVEASVTEQPDGTFTTDLTAVPLVVDRNTLTVYPTHPTHRPPDLPPGLAAELDASFARVLAVLDDGSGRDALRFE